MMYHLKDISDIAKLVGMHFKATFKPNLVRIVLFSLQVWTLMLPLLHTLPTWHGNQFKYKILIHKRNN